MLIMTAMEIITMLNEFWRFLLSLVGGVLSGLLASHIFHKRTRKVERTKIIISQEIARRYIKTKDHGFIVEYRTKISNETPQDAYDIKGYARIRYKRKYLTIQLPSIPILHGNNGLYKEFDYQRIFPFRLTSLNPDTIKGSEATEILKLYESKKLELHHFKDEDTILEIVIMSVDSISGGALDVQIATFNYNDFETKVKTGEFDEKTLTVNTYKDKTPEENDHNNQANF